MGRSRDIGRTFDSGAKKRIKQKKQEEFLKKQCGALNKFPGFNLKSTTSSKDNSKDDFTFPHSEVSINNINLNFSNISSTSTSYSTIEKDQFDNSFLNIKNLDDIKAPIISTSSCSSSAQSTSIIKICSQEKDNNCFNNIAVSIANNDAILLSKNDSVQPLVIDLNDPACWPQSMSHTTQIQIVERGPIRNLDIVFPLRKKSGRRFSIAHYCKTMSNGEIVVSLFKNCRSCLLFCMQTI